MLRSHAQRFLVVVVNNSQRFLVAVAKIVGHLKFDHDGRKKKLRKLSQILEEKSCPNLLRVLYLSNIFLRKCEAIQKIILVLSFTKFQILSIQ